MLVLCQKRCVRFTFYGFSSAQLVCPQLQTEHEGTRCLEEEEKPQYVLSKSLHD